jgi:benzoyl-CoA reductase/2-hydroxyglutaryl-CoA dehydratase subunit BcrC/BadD/HgdB
MEALASYYLAEDEVNWQCPAFLTANRLEERLRYMVEAVANQGIQGVVFAIPLYCDMHAWDTVELMRRLEAKGIRTLKIEVEGNMKSETVRSRIGSFIETINPA